MSLEVLRVEKALDNKVKIQDIKKVGSDGILVIKNNNGFIYKNIFAKNLMKNVHCEIIQISDNEFYCRNIAEDYCKFVISEIKEYIKRYNKFVRLLFESSFMGEDFDKESFFNSSISNMYAYRENLLFINISGMLFIPAGTSLESADALSKFKKDNNFDIKFLLF